MSVEKTGLSVPLERDSDCRVTILLMVVTDWVSPKMVPAELEATAR